ncbi:MAG: hypothetical protein IKW05_00285 [Muribaculaceae bacterium]|nr:hypothetical protein [Muribaculaceae bacterium]
MKNYSIDILNDLYKYIKYVLSEELSPREAAEKIYQLHNIPISSFINYYLNAYRKMMQGKVMRGGQIPQGIRVFFLDKIYENEGINGLTLALKSYRETIEYYKSRGENPKGDIALYEEYIKKIE